MEVGPCHFRSAGSGGGAPSQATLHSATDRVSARMPSPVRALGDGASERAQRGVEMPRPGVVRPLQSIAEGLLARHGFGSPAPARAAAARGNRRIGLHMYIIDDDIIDTRMDRPCPYYSHLNPCGSSPGTSRHPGYFCASPLDTHTDTPIWAHVLLIKVLEASRGHRESRPRAYNGVELGGTRCGADRVRRAHDADERFCRNGKRASGHARLRRAVNPIPASSHMRRWRKARDPCRFRK